MKIIESRPVPEDAPDGEGADVPAVLRSYLSGFQTLGAADTGSYSLLEACEEMAKQRREENAARTQLVLHPALFRAYLAHIADALYGEAGRENRQREYAKTAHRTRERLSERQQEVTECGAVLDDDWVRRANPNRPECEACREARRRFEPERGT